MIKVLVEGRTPSEMRENLESFFQSVRDEQTTPAKMSQAAVTAPQPDVDDIEDVDDTPALPVVTAPLPITSYHATKGTVLEFGVDSRGIPWDERIHTSGDNKTNKNGTWRQRRGVEPKLVAQVEMELLARMKSEHQEVASPVGVTVPQPLAPAISQTPPPVIASPVPASVPQQVAQPIQVVPPAALPPLPQASLAHTLDTFKANLFPTLAELTKLGKLTPEYIQSLNKYFGVEQIYQVNESQKEMMFNNFVEHGLIQRVQ